MAVDADARRAVRMTGRALSARGDGRWRSSATMRAAPEALLSARDEAGASQTAEPEALRLPWRWFDRQRRDVMEQRAERTAIDRQRCLAVLAGRERRARLDVMLRGAANVAPCGELSRLENAGEYRRARAEHHRGDDEPGQPFIVSGCLAHCLAGRGRVLLPLACRGTKKLRENRADKGPTMLAVRERTERSRALSLSFSFAHRPRLHPDAWPGR